MGFYVLDNVLDLEIPLGCFTRLEPSPQEQSSGYGTQPIQKFWKQFLPSTLLATSNDQPAHCYIREVASHTLNCLSLSQEFEIFMNGSILCLQSQGGGAWSIGESEQTTSIKHQEPQSPSHHHHLLPSLISSGASGKCGLSWLSGRSSWPCSACREVKGQDLSPLEGTVFKLRRALGKHWENEW